MARSRSAIVELPPLDGARRRDCWQRALSRRAIPLDDSSLDHLARRYRLEPEQIDRAVDGVRQTLPGDAVMEPLCEAARAQTRGALDRVARRIPLRHTWDDLVLPARTVEELRELCDRIERADQVFDVWGFGRKLSGTGTAALFAGPSGAGKTLAAAVVARSVGLDLFKIDLAGVVSKYIGETEQNLERIFAAADGANAILFFDEADAIFGKRTEVRDSHDRYANLEVSYLLQKLESYGGPTILATNLSQHMDESLLRRFAFTVRFPLPDEIGRRRIWRRMWPKAAPARSGGRPRCARRPFPAERRPHPQRRAGGRVSRRRRRRRRAHAAPAARHRARIPEDGQDRRARPSAVIRGGVMSDLDTKKPRPAPSRLRRRAPAERRPPSRAASRCATTCSWRSTRTRTWTPRSS